MADDKAQPGDPLRIKASTWNSVVDAANDYEQRRRLGTGGRGERSPISHTSIKVRNDSGADRRFGEVLEISSSPLLDDLEAGALWFIGVEPEADGRVYGITRRPIRDGAIDELQIAGVVRAWVNVTDEGHKYAKVTSGESVLQSNAASGVRILYKPTGTGELLCAVSLAERAAPATGEAPAMVNYYNDSEQDFVADFADGAEIGTTAQTDASDYWTPINSPVTKLRAVVDMQVHYCATVVVRLAFSSTIGIWRGVLRCGKSGEVGPANNPIPSGGIGEGPVAWSYHARVADAAWLTGTSSGIIDVNENEDLLIWSQEITATSATAYLSRVSLNLICKVVEQQ